VINQTREPPRALTELSVVWVTAAQADASAAAECVDLSTAVRRATGAPPRSFSLMLRTSALRVLVDVDCNAVSRAHRIVVCEDGSSGLQPHAVSHARVGYLPRWFDVDASSGALVWLASRQAFVTA
jgi:hypothetical protein